MPKPRGELGPLERSIMEFMWTREDEAVTVRDVASSRVGRGLAYTTVMTVLDRLSRKGYVSRRRQGRAYLYRVRRTRGEHLGGVVHEILAGTGDRKEAFLGFAREASPEDLEALRRAIQTVQRERRGRSG